MEDKDSVTRFCKCCLNENGLRDMWAGYISSDTGEFEIFGQMITDCFTLPWSPPDDDTTLELICDSCIERIRISYNFKKEILETNELLTEGKTATKPELPADTTEFILPDEKQPNEDDEQLNEDDEQPNEVDEQPNEDECFEEEWLAENVKQEPETEYEEVEYLEDEDVPTGSDDKKNTKKIKKERSYKGYSEEELKTALEHIKNKTLSMTKASEMYNIPPNTLRQKIGIDEKELLLLREKRETVNRKQKQLIAEVKSLLTYTNATVYKIKNSHLYCAYCLEPFENPEELRVHSRTKHSAERIKAIDQMLRRNSKTEVVRVDVYNLHCTICCLILNNWTDMFDHLQKCHNVEFSEAHSRVIPYILTKENNCAMCKDRFLSFSHLDNHMNQHFKNFTCPDCGEYYLSELRLKLHMKIHKVGHYPCHECGKVFTLEHYRMKHIRMSHNNVCTVKCMYCFGKFISEYQRYLHIKNRHPDKTGTYICELCGEAFDWHPYYARHVKRMHQEEGKYICRFCTKKFVLKRDKLSHEKSMHAEEKSLMILHMKNLSNYMNAQKRLRAGVDLSRRKLNKPKNQDGDGSKKPKKIIVRLKDSFIINPI